MRHRIIDGGTGKNEGKGTDAGLEPIIFFRFLNCAVQHVYHTYKDAQGGPVRCKGGDGYLIQ